MTFLSHLWNVVPKQHDFFYKKKTMYYDSIFSYLLLSYKLKFLWDTVVYPSYAVYLGYICILRAWEIHFIEGPYNIFPLFSYLKWASSMPRFFNDFWMWLSRCIAGQCRTNPWPAVPDWPWCRNADAGLKKLTTGLTFLWHSGIPIFTYEFFNIIQH